MMASSMSDLYLENDSGRDCICFDSEFEERYDKDKLSLERHGNFDIHRGSIVALQKLCVNNLIFGNNLRLDTLCRIT